MIKHLIDALSLDGAAMPLPLQGERGDQTLNLGCFAVLLSVLLLHSPVCVDILAHIVVLAQIKELADLGCPLGATHARLVCVCQPRNFASSCTKEVIQSGTCNPACCTDAATYAAT